jgi:hypothetical protein
MSRHGRQRWLAKPDRAVVARCSAAAEIDDIFDVIRSPWNAEVRA